MTVTKWPTSPINLNPYFNGVIKISHISIWIHNVALGVYNHTKAIKSALKYSKWQSNKLEVPYFNVEG